jgi:hypothetical protein
MIMKTTNAMNCVSQMIISSQLYMFRAMFLSIIRNTWLYLQHLVIFTTVADQLVRGGFGTHWVPFHPRHQLVSDTRCKYSQVLLMMGENIAWNMLSWLETINWPIELHRVGWFLNYIMMHGFMNINFIEMNLKNSLKAFVLDVSDSL